MVLYQISNTPDYLGIIIMTMMSFDVNKKSENKPSS